MNDQPLYPPGELPDWRERIAQRAHERDIAEQLALGRERMLARRPAAWVPTWAGLPEVHRRRYRAAVEETLQSIKSAYEWCDRADREGGLQ